MLACGRLLNKLAQVHSNNKGVFMANRLTTAEFLEIAKELATAILATEKGQEIADHALDIVENYVKASKPKFDDIVVLPACQIVRKTMHIPDND